jgi:hypothetical protein
MKSVRSQCVRPVFVNGDLAVVRWIFEFETLEGAHISHGRARLPAMEGDRIAEECFFYDPHAVGAVPLRGRNMAVRGR